MLFRFLLIVLLLVPAACSTSAVLTEPEPVSYSVDDASAHSAILSGMAKRKWSVREDAPGVIHAMLRLRTHEVVVAIRYGNGKINFDYHDSKNMNFRMRGESEIIHRKYIAWTLNLANDIRAVLAAANS